MGAGDRRALCSDALCHQVVQLWLEDGVKKSTIAVYLRWVRRFQADCRRRNVSETSQLRSLAVAGFARSYAQERGIDGQGSHAGARSALFSWASALAEIGHEIPEWTCRDRCAESSPRWIREFSEFQTHHRGIANASARKQCKYTMEFLHWLRVRRRRIPRLRLTDVDAFVIELRKRYARSTVADYCSSLRSFLRFLHATGRLSSEFSPCVAAPIVRRRERPARGLPWSDVQQILRAVDRSTRSGRRDYALLLLMAAYGMGAAEVVALRLEDVDWSRGQLIVRRPKTGAVVYLPLLPHVARALFGYLRKARPRRARTRTIFVRMRTPHGPLSSSAVRHVLKARAAIAGVSGKFLGGHAFRHSHAGRQIELGALPKVLSDILGHRRPESTSAYVRIATARLRALALAVPR